MNHIPRATTWSTEHTWVLISVWTAYTVFYDFAWSGRNKHPYKEISQGVEQAGIHWTLY